MAATNLRQMRIEDLPSVNALLIRAFSAARREEGFRRPELALCRMEFLRFYLQDAPASCWVVEAEGGLCGAVFGHGLGRVGWIGPLAVSPESQRQGLGRSLLQRCEEALRGLGCSLIGLETDAGSLYNLAFYSGLGYTPGPLLVDLSRAVEPGRMRAPDPAIVRYAQDPALFIACLPAFLAANRIEADYLHLAGLLHRERFGESFLEMAGEEPQLFAALQLVPVSVQEKEGVGRIMAVVGPGGTDAARLERFLCSIAGMAGCSHIVLRLSTWYPLLITGLLRRGWSLNHSHLRFYLTGGETHGQGVMHLNKWD